AEMARLEDIVLAFGKAALLEEDANVVDPGVGIFSSASDKADGDEASPKHVLDKLKEGVKHVRQQYPGALNAVLGFESYMALVQDDNKEPGLKRAKATLGGGEVGQIPYNTTRAPRDKAIAVFAPDPGALDLVWTQRPQITHLQVTDGNALLRLEEAFVLRIKD